MSVSGKGKQQKQVRQLRCQEQCIEHTRYNLSGLSRAHFFREPFLKQLYTLSPRTPSLLQQTYFRSSFLSLKNAMHLLNKLQWRDVLTQKICREGRGMNLLTCYYIDLYRDALCNLDRKQTIIVHNDYSVFSLTWPASMQIYWNKRIPCLTLKTLKAI